MSIHITAYQAETPWDKLGVGRSGIENPDIKTMLAAGGLAGWELTKQELFTADGQKVKNRVAIRRDGTDKRILSVVGKDYQLLQNETAFEDVLQPACEEFGLVIDRLGYLGQGDRVWVQARVPQATIEPVDGDKIDGFLTLSNGHNGWTPYAGRLTQVRIVCANTFAAAMRDQSFMKLVHTSQMESKLDQAHKLVTGVIEAAQASKESFGKLAMKKMTEKQMGAYIRRVLGVKNITEDISPATADKHAKILELATTAGKGIEFAPGTAWAAFNAVTEYVDHVRTAETKSVKRLAEANTSALFGTGAQMKARAMKLALDVVAS